MIAVYFGAPYAVLGFVCVWCDRRQKRRIGR